MTSLHPVYLQVRDQLWHWVTSTNLPSQARLPAERELAQRFNTTRVTLRQALGQLEAEGRIYRSNRRGWFVTPARLSYEPSRDLGFNHYVTEQGFVPDTETLSKTLTEAPRWLAERSSISVGEPIYHILRRRFVSGRCVLVEHNYVNPEKCPGLLQQDTDQSLWGILRDAYQLVPAEREIEVCSQALGAEEAGILNVHQGSTGLYLERLCYDESGEFMEFDREYWLHDAIKLRVKISG
ncbi:UTRA domain-containing protein [Aestuariirhabdus sp. Z084]|uniref:UTRA domain-containing protein n=1 Tax=Aestuariirhabdus haliotis TaxID=2918751 RepID=UPI00201B3C1A|nr:UTRA domain-containing protein [Aestuariirhabdus haliotis]MCL6417618.1 UTRA domain-containing protein [Aestuariirhabdus haliotis]MCL6421544.1 UTRA domain-containing protein [Aestuariirhabdus haliotis]